MLSGKLDKRSIPRDPTRRRDAIARNRPQIMIAGDPDQFSEAATQRAECQLLILQAFRQITGDDQPIVAVIRDIEQRPPVDRV